MRRHSALAWVFFSVGTAHAADVLTLDAALAAAREHQPQLVQVRATIESARSRVDVAGAGLLPQVQAQASYGLQTRNLPDTGATSRLMGAGTSSFDVNGTLSAGVSASQLIYDFGRTTGQRDVSRTNVEVAIANERVLRQQIGLGVRQTFADVQAQKALLAVAQTTLENQKKHEEQTKAFIEAGTRPPIDGVQARVDRANAVVQLVNAENGYLSAKARLNQACGVVREDDFDVDEAPMAPVPGEDAAASGLLDAAIQASPGLLALQTQLKAAEQTITATHAGLWPILDATTGLNESGPGPTTMAWNWQGLVRLTWPLYQGGITTAQEAAARMDLLALRAQLDGATQNLRLRIEQARLAVRAGKEAAAASEEALMAATERLRLAEGRYETGSGSIIELADAQLGLTNAAAQKVRAQHDVAIARAELMAALGGE